MPRLKEQLGKVPLLVDRLSLIQEHEIREELSLLLVEFERAGEAGGALAR